MILKYINYVVHLFKKNLKSRYKNKSNEFISGYEAALNDVKWLKWKLDRKELNSICNKYFTNSGVQIDVPETDITGRVITK